MASPNPLLQIGATIQKAIENFPRADLTSGHTLLNTAPDQLLYRNLGEGILNTPANAFKGAQTAGEALRGVKKSPWDLGGAALNMAALPLSIASFGLGGKAAQTVSQAPKIATQAEQIVPKIEDAWPAVQANIKSIMAGPSPSKASLDTYFNGLPANIASMARQAASGFYHALPQEATVTNFNPANVGTARSSAQLALEQAIKSPTASKQMVDKILSMMSPQEAAAQRTTINGVYQLLPDTSPIQAALKNALGTAKGSYRPSDFTPPKLFPEAKATLPKFDTTPLKK